MLVALGLGLLCAIAIHFSAILRRALYPLLVGSQTIPIVLVAPLLVAWWGFGLAPKLAIVALVCFFPVVVPTLDALDRVDGDLRKLMRTLGASRWQTFLRVTLPAIRWGVAYGVVLSVARAIGEFGAVSVVSGKISGETITLPLLVENRFSNFDLAGAYAASALMAVIALATLLAMTLLQRKGDAR
ncbi:MAG: ABC transporter permease subunit, partial [Solirubrobacterales bacterium]